ncbi:MAG TPA: hypothetical protein VF246_10185 [Acidimicrobiia bacterium]
MTKSDLKTLLQDLPIPEHRGDFWTDLDRRLAQEGAGAHRSPGRRRRWRLPAVLVAAVLVFTLVLSVGVPDSMLPAVLAYTYEPGTYTYELSYVATSEADGTRGRALEGRDSRTEAEGTLTYIVEAGTDTDARTVRIQSDITATNSVDGPIVDVPEVKVTIDAEKIVEIDSPVSEESVPDFVMPEPFPGGRRALAGLPFGFGPSFPDRPLAVGDTWTTTRPVSGDVGVQVIGTHEVLREETVAGRDTVVIHSVYEVPEVSFEDRGRRDADIVIGPIRIEATIWFDREAGIIVRAEVVRTSTTQTTFESGQVITSERRVETVVELSEQS